jgi:hypothetical protein
VPPGLARSRHGRRLRIKRKASQDLLDDWPLQNGRDDLELPAAAVRAVFDW